MNKLHAFTLPALAVALVTAALTSACAPPPPAGLTQADRDAINASTDAWMTAANAGDWTTVAAEYTEDAIVMPPNAPATMGREAIGTTFAATTPPGAQFEFEIQEIDGVGDLAFVRATYTMTIPVGEETMTDVGKYVELRRKQANGRWLISRDMYNSDNPIPGVETEK